jgi:hypothetical protein
MSRVAVLFTILHLSMVTSAAAADRSIAKTAQSAAIEQSGPGLEQEGVIPSVTGLNLPEAPPADAFAVTGDYLPLFVRETVQLWQHEFPDIPLTANGVIFVIRPDAFYADLDPGQRLWLATREMLGIRNFPIIINPLTPGDDWYFRAQREWRAGNRDAIYVLLTSLYHEIIHTDQSGDERQAYQSALDLFEHYRKQGKLRTAYGRMCYALLRARYADLVHHPDRYVQVRIRFRQQDIALLVRSPKASPPL